MLRAATIRVVVVFALALALTAACSDDDDGSIPDATDSTAPADDRDLFNDEVDGVSAVVADCFVNESGSTGRRYTTTVEVHNDSTATQAVTVTIIAEHGRGGVSEAVEVPASATDAWPVVADEETTDSVGDVECADYVTGVEISVLRLGS